MRGEILRWFILYSSPNLTHKKLNALIDEKKKIFGDFFTEDVLLELIADELNISIKHKPIQVRIHLGQLTPGLNDVSLEAFVEAVSSLHEFERKDGTIGKVINVIVRENSDRGKVVFWNETAEKAADLKPGQKIRIEGAYTRRDVEGATEIHLGKNAKFSVIGE